MFYYLALSRKVSWPMKWRMKCKCELAQIIIVNLLFKKCNSLIRYIPILMERSKCMNICVFKLDCNVPRQVITSHSKINVSKSYKELYMTFIPNEILIFVILNFIPYFWKYIFYFIKSEDQNRKSAIKTISFLADFRDIVPRITVKFLG